MENVPLTSSQAKKMDVEDVAWEFSHIGFTNISRIEIPDLINGWIVKEDSVEMVEIDGKTDYRKSDKIRIDAEIVIKYHTFQNRRD